MNKENLNPTNEATTDFNMPLKPVNTNISLETNKSPTNDNIDKHFQLIHETNSEIQQQLYRVETSTAQTNVDLEQLYVRSKSNNENLNKLLKNIVDYSNEVITEGNATKSDMSLVLKKLEDIQLRQKENKNDFNINKIKDEIRSFLEERDFNDMETKMEVEKLYNYLKDNQNKISDQIRIDLDKMSKSNDIKLDRMSDQINELKHESKSTGNIQKIEQLLENFSIDNKLNLNITNKQQELSSIENKIQTLEQKYNLLSNKYNEKFNQFINLQQKFENLSNEINEIQIINQPMNQINNLKKFHKSNLEKIEEKQQNLIMNNRQRVVSTPVRFTNNSDDEKDNDNNNNDNIT
ncbi:uncharacterized protein KGF55_002736 [Candida pseudojiufengensis]|uniref:uncharacterized protein n=1 Tax=Candida pseudojiufengensis TaxID=497109 RepID=UPI00222481EC|nr:uncharacterized protein KGF55_002736 [Candida pseudojiufengensis]KAI5962944.1 hypothetical protein KGF55_002736 [Candida pseudojiufengensis]